ncbi:uncharacterized protein BBOV_IV007750 [Babesia bovis T2Bo]|uniref:Membrane protein, putative n=2 Tax=Babesia bovis TaxID=5865 RepID=A7ARG0_BABBO|nr:uncharacterized protein BBOV_IV007750 [Babesia bovis T2Bo]EDO07129.1 bov57-like protein [Babesia bovis T2Bo]|eukprot:XP_001610697.1 hypothetical protein [Babesia bovis T2Bo]
MAFAKLSILFTFLLVHLVSTNAFDLGEWSHDAHDTHDIKAHHESAADAAPGAPAQALSESEEMEKALKALEEETKLENKPNETPAPVPVTPSAEEKQDAPVEENKKVDQPKIEIPALHPPDSPLHTDKDDALDITTAPFTLVEDPASHENELTSEIPQTPADDTNVNAGNEDSIITDTTPIAKSMRLNTVTKIDETIEKLNHRFQTFLESVASSAHDLTYYQSLLDTAYDVFCREINGDMSPMGSGGQLDKDGNGVTLMISAEMSSAIRRSFDTKVEVLELAASEVASQKSKEVGAQTIHDALTVGLRTVRDTITSPGMTIHTTSNDMKNMTAIVADMSKGLLADIIKWTLKEDVLKKRLFDKIVERDNFIKTSPDELRMEAFTHAIRELAGEFHNAQKEKTGAIEKQNGFKEYMDEMREDINTIQRLIDTYFATVHKGHAKAILYEASKELRKDGNAESQLRLRVAEQKVHQEELKKAEPKQEDTGCPYPTEPQDPRKPIGFDNPCIIHHPHIYRW